MNRSAPRLRTALSAISLTGLLLAAACAVNPATGAREISLVSTSQEIAIGQEADPSIVAQMGLYPDSSVQRYVRELGLRLAAVSERPELPWTFRVLDDPTVNAFALPGGYIYVTRGILTHLTSEAQLAGVLGHEIGHVTARHGANRMSRAQLAQLGLGLGSIFAEDLYRQFGGLVEQATGLLFLSFGRGDELEADELGLRYMTRVGYEPEELAGVMDMLDRTSQMAASSGRLPEWLSTHPNPGNRIQRIQASIADHPEYDAASTVAADPLLDRLDGMTYGRNPREGYVEDGVFHHPDLAFRFVPPSDWRVVNGREAVQVAPEDGSALLELRLAPEDPVTAARAFGAREGIAAGSLRERTVNGLPAASLPFSATTDNGELAGEGTWIRYGERTYAFLALSTASGWQSVASTLRTSVDSFRQEADGDVLAVRPFQVDVVQLPSPTPWQVFLDRYPSQVDAPLVALINQVDEGAALPESRVKRVVR